VSSRQANVEPGSEPENVKPSAVVVIGPLGPVSIEVSGGVVSTVNVRDAGVGSGLPAG
jgi:hypothetical protein